MGYHLLSVASSYQEWFWVKTQAFKRDQALIFYNAQTPRLITKTGVYAEEALIWGNTVCMQIKNTMSIVKKVQGQSEAAF